MTVVMNAFLAAIGAGILTLIIICVKWLWKKITADSLTLRALAHDSFFRMARELVAKDYVTESELENLEILYKGYKAQGLNGTGKRMYEIVMDLPVRSDGPIR